MRISNEQLKILAAPICSTECQSCVASEYCCGDGSSELAADLLEARELIKEMRSELEERRAELEGYEESATGEKYNSPSLNNLLDRTKDYAE